MRISDWSSDVCSSDLRKLEEVRRADQRRRRRHAPCHPEPPTQPVSEPGVEIDLDQDRHREQRDDQRLRDDLFALKPEQQHERREQRDERDRPEPSEQPLERGRSEEHTSELQSLMRISYAVFCLKKNTRTKQKKYRNLLKTSDDN